MYPLLFFHLHQRPTRSNNIKSPTFCLWRSPVQSHEVDRRCYLRVHNDLTSLEELERKWQICFHPAKCTVISVSERRQLHHQTSQALHGHTLEEIGCGKYLGLNINKDLTRWKHINKNISKASKTLGFLRRNIGWCTPATKSTACTTLVRPSLECAVPVWNPHQITTIRGIDQVQRRAARIACNCCKENCSGCVPKLLDQLQWESLQHRRWNRVLWCVIRSNTSWLPLKYSQTKYYTSGDSRVRGNHNIRQTRVQRDIFYHSFFPRTTREWNRLPKYVLESGSLEVFRARVNTIPQIQTHHN